MTTFRFCTFNNNPCSCDNVAMQPCLAGLIKRYLKVMREIVLRPDEDERLHLYISRREIEELYRTYPNWIAVLKRKIKGFS